MKRVIYAMLLMTIFFCVGCDKKNDYNEEKEITKQIKEIDLSKYQLPTVQKDVLLTDLQNCDMTYCFDHFMGANIRFNLYTYQKLSEGDVNITLNTDIPYSYGISEPTKCEMGYENFLAYNGENFVYDEGKEYSISQDEYLNVVASIDSLYSYTVDLVIDPGFGSDGRINTNYDNKEITSMTVKALGSEYTFDIGVIKFDDKIDTTSINNEECPFLIESTGIFNETISYNPDGEFIIEEKNLGIPEEEFDFTFFEDINAGNSYKVKKYEILIDEEGVTKSYTWNKGDVIHVKKGSSISIKETCESKIVSDELKYNINACILVEYKNAKGKNREKIDYEARMSEYTAYDLYAYYIDDIDVINSYVKSAFEYSKGIN